MECTAALEAAPRCEIHLIALFAFRRSHTIMHRIKPGAMAKSATGAARFDSVPVLSAPPRKSSMHICETERHEHRMRSGEKCGRKKRKNGEPEQ